MNRETNEPFVLMNREMDKPFPLEKVHCFLQSEAILL